MVFVCRNVYVHVKPVLMTGLAPCVPAVQLRKWRAVVAAVPTGQARAERRQPGTFLRLGSAPLAWLSTHMPRTPAAAKQCVNTGGGDWTLA